MAKKKPPPGRTEKEQAGKHKGKGRKPRPAADINRQVEIQQALYQIADAASAASDMQSFYADLHKIVGKIMVAENFYVSLYDPATGILASPYFADTTGDTPPPPIKIDKSNKSLRAHVVLKGKTLHLSQAEIEEGRRTGKFKPMGSPTVDWIGVPLKTGGQVIGSLTVQSYQQGIRYQKQDVQLLEFVAQHIAVALTRARAIDETRQHIAELQIINSVQEGLASQLDMQAIYDLVGDKIREIFHDADTNIRMYDPETNLLHLKYSYVRGRHLLQGSSMLLPDFGFSAHVLRTRETLVINENLPLAVKRYGSKVLPGVPSPRSAVFVPLAGNGQASGLIVLFDTESEHAFNDSDVRLLETLADSMSVALENVRLFNETQRLLRETEQRAQELAIINSVQEGLASRLDMQGIYDLVGEKIRETFHNMDVGIRIYDAGTNMLHYPFTYENGRRISIESIPLPERGFGPHVLRTAETLVINENMPLEMEKFGSGVYPGTLMSKSLVMVPLVADNRGHGVLTLNDFNHEKAFKESDVRLLETLANSMSVALENARLWEQEKLYRKALERELEIGREIQGGFLPQALPLVEGWEIAASLMSAREVAGDFYDAFELPDGTIGIVIADVCDKGVGAALFMTLFRSLIRATANLEYFEHTQISSSTISTAERLKRSMLLTNNYIAETHGESGMFATLFFGILEPREGNLTYINGGHEPPRITRSGRVRETLHKTGPAVGAITNCTFGILETQLLPGDTLFSFTDGVPDCRDPDGRFFGRERLQDILETAGGSAHELIDTMQLELSRYIAGATQFDDITLMAVRRR